MQVGVVQPPLNLLKEFFLLPLNSLTLKMLKTYIKKLRKEVLS